MLRVIFHNALSLFTSHEQALCRLDAAAGDGDHGATMLRGLRAAASAVDAAAAAPEPCPPGHLLAEAGEAFADAAGGASGALFGALFTTVGRKLPEGEIRSTHVAAALAAGQAQVAKLGKAAPGDKTLLDALAPFVAAFTAAAEEGADTASAWRHALPAAEAGAAATAEMVARRGRASRLGERSRGHVDPGAQSVVYLLQAVEEALLHDS